jgi:hypothetical protein
MDTEEKISVHNIRLLFIISSAISTSWLAIEAAAQTGHLADRGYGTRDFGHAAIMLWETLKFVVSSRGKESAWPEITKNLCLSF